MSFRNTKGIKNQQMVLYPYAFHPKAQNNNYALAGLLACSTFDCLPVPANPEQWREVVNLFSELTATGIAPDFNRIPFSSMLFRLNKQETIAVAKIERIC